MATLTNKNINDTYFGLLKTNDNEVIDGLTRITDGLGCNTSISLNCGNEGACIHGNLTFDTLCDFNFPEAGSSTNEIFIVNNCNVTLGNVSSVLDVCSDNLCFNSNVLDLEENIEVDSITFSDGTIIETFEKAAFYGVTVSKVNNRTTPAEMRADRLDSNFNGAWDMYTKGSIEDGINNKAPAARNSIMYTMNVDVINNTTITMYLFNLDDAYYIYVDDVLVDSYIGVYNSTDANERTFSLNAGRRRIDIVKNDYGGGSSYFTLMGNIIGTDVKFVSGF